MSTLHDHPLSDELLISYASGELVPAMRIFIEQHLSTCDECRQTVAIYRQVEQVLRADDSIAPSAQAVTRARAVFTPHPIADNTSWLQRLGNWLMPPRGLLALSVPSALVAAVIILMLGWLLTPTVSNALPGDTFYPVKLTVESLQLAIAIDDASQVQTQLAIAGTRVKDMNALAAQQRYTDIPVLAADYATHVQSATSGLGRVAAQSPSAHATLAPKVEQNLKQDTQTLALLQDASPASIQPEIAQAASVAAAARSAVQEQIINPLVAPSQTPTATLTPTATHTATSTNTASPTASSTPTNTPTVSTPTFTPTPTQTFAPTATSTATITPTVSLPSPTGTETPLPPADTLTPVPPAPTSTPVPPTMTPLPISVAPGNTDVPSNTPTDTAMPVSTATPQPTSSPAPTKSHKSTPTLRATRTPKATLPTATAQPSDALTPTATPVASPNAQLLLTAIQDRGDPPQGPSVGDRQTHSGTGETGCAPKSLFCSVSFTALVPYAIVLLVCAGLIRWMSGLASLTIRVSPGRID